MEQMTMYNLYYKNDNDRFYEICRLLEKDYPEFEKQKELIDVDGSIVQAYFNGEKQIIVINGMDWDCIFARANINLKEFVSNLETGFMN